MSTALVWSLLAWLWAGLSVWLAFKLRVMRQRKDDAYEERNRLVAAFAFVVASKPGGRAWLGQHPPDPDWHPSWRTIVFVEVPGIGQMSWHVHDRDRPLFVGLPIASPRSLLPPWDGHTTAEKYERLARVCR
jgi:hypothetical protein